ncbi:MAG: hypothetical protein MPW17_23120 (plasmid) [Candidatus Manganitrophus sp.]|nr:MAG: hypothetical protein MPW17_23120 [Candidatus Manganitrophus sp.]
MLFMVGEIKLMIGSGALSNPDRQYPVQQAGMIVSRMSRKRFMFILIAGMMKGQADLITFSGKEGLMGIVH